MFNRRLITIGNLLRRVFWKLRGFSPRHLLDVETWKRLGRWIRWRTSLKRRRIRRLTKRLIPLHPDASPEMRRVRDEVFAQTCLKLKKLENRRALLELLNGANLPLGPEQVFLSAIYPQLLRRNLGIFLLSTTTPHRLDVEIGYLGHNEDYFFWFFEIDGATKDKPDRKFSPERKIRGDKIYAVYRLGVAGLVKETQSQDAPQWMINSQVLFNNALADLRRLNYKVTAASIPRFAQERLSLLRRLALSDLKKRRPRS